jgi:rSAM/selenodomain-associated transferase 1
MNKTKSPPEPESIIVFAKYPRLGRVKTRLEGFLGREGCLGLHEAMLGDSIERLSVLGRDLFLFLAGCEAAEGHTLMNRFGYENVTNTTVRIQEGSDLGDRMWKAYMGVSRYSHKVLIVGGDTPSLPLQYVQSAFECLDRSSLVFGPTFDGGYYLIGLSERREDVFRDVNWGSPSVLEETLNKVKQSDYQLLPEWYDVDIESDITRLAGDLSVHFDGFPRRTRQFLAEAGILDR